MEFTSAQSEQRWAAFVRAAPGCVAAFDFDGTLSPIVDDPTEAHIHPEAGRVLVELARQVRALAVVTGRPARQALDLGALEEVGAAVAEHGKELHVLGQYGNERWSSSSPRIVSPPPPEGLGAFVEALPGLLNRADAAGAWIEEKGLAVAIHTRRLPDPRGAFERLLPVVRAEAAGHDLAVEPGRNVVEVRAPGMHKGLAVETLAAELDAEGFLFAGDDLGDVEAFRAVAELRERGLATLLVCVASEEESALEPLSDVVVKGPDGVLDMLRRLIRDAAS